MTPCYPTADTNNPDAQSIPSQKGRGFGDGEGVFEANEFSATIEVARNVGVSD